MFFRNRKARAATFAGLLDEVRRAGFSVSPAAHGDVEVSRGRCAAVLRGADGRPRVVHRAGFVENGEVAVLVDGGFQKFFESPSGKRRPALAGDLREIHDFEEDLKEALGLASLYNESLGTVSTFYRYDRLSGREA